MENASVRMGIMNRADHACLAIPNLENIKIFAIIKIVTTIFGLRLKNVMMAIKLTMMVALIVKLIEIINV